MSHVRPMHPQQLPTTASAAWLIMVVVFIMFVVVPGALTLPRSSRSDRWAARVRATRQQTGLWPTPRFRFRRS